MVTAECNVEEVMLDCIHHFQSGCNLNVPRLLFLQAYKPFVTLPPSRSMRCNACLLLVILFFFVIWYGLSLVEFSSCRFFAELSFRFVCGLLLFQCLFLPCVMISE